MARYMLLLHETPNVFDGLSPDEMQAIVAAYGAWANGLRTRGKLAGGEKLVDGAARHLARGTGGALVVTDGPYAEAREAIGGYFVIQAADWAEAQAIAAECPHLAYGRVELRQVDEFDR